MKHILVIKPAIPPEDRHKIEAALKKAGYDVWGGGTDTSTMSCDISFESELDKSAEGP